MDSVRIRAHEADLYLHEAKKSHEETVRVEEE